MSQACSVDISSSLSRADAEIGSAFERGFDHVGGFKRDGELMTEAGVIRGGKNGEYGWTMAMAPRSKLPWLCSVSSSSFLMTRAAAPTAFQRTPSSPAIDDAAADVFCGSKNFGEQCRPAILDR